MDSVMLDIETMGCTPGAAIVQIGAVYFDMSGKTGVAIELNVDLQSSMDAGLAVDGATLEFWAGQSNCYWAANTMSLEHALVRLNTFLKGVSKIWCMPDFDLATIRIAMAKLKIEPSFKYNVGRDVRTMRDLKIKKGLAVEHGALADCYRQIKEIV